MSPLKIEQKPLQTIEQITPQQLEFKLKGILDEYLKDCCTVAKCDKDIRKCIPASPHSRQLSLGYDKIVEESTRARIRTATLLAQFIRMNMLSLESYCAGLEGLLERVDDVSNENPKIWEYLAEMVALLLYENILPLEKIHASCAVLISQGNAGNFLGPILKLVVSNRGPEYLASLWHSSELIFEDFLPTDDVDKFIKDNQLEFIVDGISTSDSESALTFEQIQEKLLEFFENENSFDDLSNWITVNVGDRVKDKQFIRVLATAVFENSIVGLNFNDEILRRHYKILLKYIDGNLEHEVQLLYALQAHINKLEDPQGLLLKVFMILYEDSMLSQDSIVRWESNKDPEEAEQEDIDQWSPLNAAGKKVADNSSSHEDDKLHKCNNPWRPTNVFTANVAATEDEKTKELYKKVRCILNKLTPLKFDPLLRKIKALSIDTPERLQGVIDLIFEKAIKEPLYPDMYAAMCSQLALMQVPTNSNKEGEYVNFRKLLITRCQLEFEKNAVDETARNKKIKEIETCTDAEKKKEMELILDEEDRRLRRKSVGNIRFIGELFKKQILTNNIMMRCLDNLLNNKDQESLECLSALLSTVGEELEKRKVALEHIFGSIEEIASCKDGKIDNRVRFILQDAIDLRAAKWVPRHPNNNTKTIDQIQTEANNKHLKILGMRRTDERNTYCTDRMQRNNIYIDGNEWQTCSPLISRSSPFSVQSDKLKNKVPLIDEPLGSSNMFGQWGRGGILKTSAAPAPSVNMYAALGNIGNEADKRNSMGAVKKPATPILKPTQPVKQMSTHQLELKLRNILEEYLNDCCTIVACNDDIRDSIPASALSQLVSLGYNVVLERSKTVRIRTASLFVHLIRMNTLPLESYCAGLEQVLEQADDQTIDIPNIWECLSEIVAPLLYENTLPLKMLRASCKVLISQGHGAKLLAPVFKLVVSEKGQYYLKSLWNSSELKFEEFMQVGDVDRFIKDNELEFLVGGDFRILPAAYDII